MNFSLLGTQGLPQQPIVPSDYPFTSNKVESFQPATVEAVALHRLRANARAWVGRADLGRAKRPQEQRDDDYPVNPGYYASRAFYHPRDKIPVLGDAQTYVYPQRRFNPSSPHRQSFPLYGDGSIFPFTDKYQENFSDCPTELPPGNTPAQQQWPNYQDISAYDYDQQAREHLQRANNRLSFHANKEYPVNHTKEFDVPTHGTTKFPKRLQNPVTVLGPNMPGSSIPGQDPARGISDYRPYPGMRVGPRAVTAPMPFREGRFARVESIESYKDKIIQPTHTRPHFVR